MIDRGRHSVLGVRVDAVDYEAAVAKVIEAARTRRPFAATALAVHGVMTGALDRVHRRRLNRLDLVLPDGQPVRWALGWLHGIRLADRVYGPTTMLQLCDQAARERLPIFLYGSRPEVLAALERRLVEQFPDLEVAGAQPSRFRRLEEAEVAETAAGIVACGARIVFVGLGCPRQEVWAYEMRDRINLPIVAVGAAFDFHAGLLPQAPARLQALGLEWFYRLVQEPRRLWQRYLILNPLYLALLVCEKLGACRAAESSPAPATDERFG